jgi:hypothetical protein
MFTDAQFMTAKEKELVLKDWERFLKGGLKQALFTRRLYQHLHLHCGYIAHYSQQGFYAEYFQSGPDTKRFFEYFFQNTERFVGVSEYEDLNAAMREVYERHKGTILQNVQLDMSTKLALLENCIRRAKQDGQFAYDFLQKINF